MIVTQCTIYKRIDRDATLTTKHDRRQKIEHKFTLYLHLGSIHTIDASSSKTCSDAKRHHFEMHTMQQTKRIKYTTPSTHTAKTSIALQTLLFDKELWINHRYMELLTAWFLVLGWNLCYYCLTVWFVLLQANSNQDCSTNRNELEKVCSPLKYRSTSKSHLYSQNNL